MRMTRVNLYHTKSTLQEHKNMASEQKLIFTQLSIDMGVSKRLNNSSFHFWINLSFHF